LAAALAACDGRMATLVQSSARAVAYARIYSEAHADRRPLADALAALPVHAAAPLHEPVPPPKRRGRPPGRSTTPRNGAELFAAPSIGGEVRAIDASAPATP
ncbi:MAG: hypothetical protein NT062_23990, partial [Proteobacteria bacterium]|nr:hypothetical protein [Pseudomonadota bacterium]